jgi:iron complex outermembrane receptor protein
VKSIASYRELTQSQYDNGSATTSAISATGNFTGAKFARYSLAQFRQNQAARNCNCSATMTASSSLPAPVVSGKGAGQRPGVLPMTFADAAGSITTVIPYVNYDGVTIDRASHVTTTSVGVFGQAPIPRR